jgi:hypothetical protein
MEKYSERKMNKRKFVNKEIVDLKKMLPLNYHINNAP